jgi:hypothetical protein
VYFFKKDGNYMEFLNQFLLSGPDLQDTLISLMLAAITGLLISQLYKHTHRGLNYEHTFMAALVLLAPIVSVVMLYIRGDLVLSLGLIGSLSIVRFRTAIKDTRDMVFLFWVIAVGLGAGTYNWGRSYEVQDAHWELVYELQLSELSSLSAETLITELKALPGVAEVSLLAPQLALPL